MNAATNAIRTATASNIFWAIFMLFLLSIGMEVTTHFYSLWMSDWFVRPGNRAVAPQRLHSFRGNCLSERRGEGYSYAELHGCQGANWGRNPLPTAEGTYLGT